MSSEDLSVAVKLPLDGLKASVQDRWTGRGYPPIPWTPPPKVESMDSTITTAYGKRLEVKAISLVCRYSYSAGSRYSRHRFLISSYYI